MTAKQPVEFVRQGDGGTDRRVGNRVQIEDATGIQNSVDNPVFVELVSGGGQELPTDEITGALITIDFVHHEVHEGDTFRSWYVVPHASPLANDAEINIAFTATTKFCHIVFGIGLGGNCELLLYRSPTITGGTGSALPVHNLKDGAGGATASLLLNPTVTDNGSEIDGEFLGGGTGGNANGGAVRQETEDIWTINTTYLIKLINRAGTAKQFSIEAQWYEESTN